MLRFNLDFIFFTVWMGVSMSDKYSEFDMYILHCIWEMDPNEYDSEDEYMQALEENEPILERLILEGIEQDSMVAYHHAGRKFKDNFKSIEGSGEGNGGDDKEKAIEYLKKAALKGCPGACGELFEEGLALGMDQIQWGAYSLLIFKSIDVLKMNAGTKFPLNFENQISSEYLKLEESISRSGRQVWDYCDCFA